MQDRPSYDELLGAVERFLIEEIMPSVEGSRRFHARVAANVPPIGRRGAPGFRPGCAGPLGVPDRPDVH